MSEKTTTAEAPKTTTAPEGATPKAWEEGQAAIEKATKEYRDAKAAEAKAAEPKAK